MRFSTILPGSIIDTKSGHYKDETAIEGVSVAQYILSCHAEHIAKKDKR